MSEANALNQDQKPVSKFASLPKWRYASLVILSVMLIAFQLYIALVRPLDKWIQVPVHLCLALAIAFIHKPVADKCKTTVTKALGWAYDIFMLAGVAYCAYYFISNLSYLQNRIYNVDSMTTADLLCAYWLLIIVMEAVRRFMGMNLFIFICVFIAYAFLGQKISGIFKFRGMSWQSFGEVMVMDPNGILGSPLSSSVNTLFYFLLFGAFFSVCGGGQVLIDLGMKLSDKTAGGPAKASVVSSGLMGMISGSAVANVTSTGVMTIPLMKKSGYEPHQAGAIEAVASTGGQIMPPIMGVGAFIMAEMIGISYTRIAMAAIIPALAYYGSVFLLVHFLAKKKKMNSHDEAVVCKTAPIMPRIYQLAPIIVLVVMIFMGSSLTRAALVGSALAIIVSFISKDTRMNVSQFIDAMLDGTKQAYGIAIPTAACGIMTGIVVQSGVANKLTKIIAATGSSSLALALIITMLGCMLLGMALPGCGLPDRQHTVLFHTDFPGNRPAACQYVYLLLRRYRTDNSSGMPGVLYCRRYRRGKLVEDRLDGICLCTCILPDPLCLRVPSGSSAAGNRYGGGGEYGDYGIRNYFPGRRYSRLYVCTDKERSSPCSSGLRGSIYHYS